jgi:hypothetical protein
MRTRSCSTSIRLNVKNAFHQGWKNLGWTQAVRDIKCCIGCLYSWVLSMNLHHVILLAYRILRWLLDVWNICGLARFIIINLAESNYSAHPVHVTEFSSTHSTQRQLLGRKVNKRGQRSSGILSDLSSKLVTDVSGQPIDQIFKGQAVREDSWVQVDAIRYRGRYQQWLVPLPLSFLQFPRLLWRLPFILRVFNPPHVLEATSRSSNLVSCLSRPKD